MYAEFYFLYSDSLKNIVMFWSGITGIFHLSPLQGCNLKIHTNCIRDVVFPQQQKDKDFGPLGYR